MDKCLDRLACSVYWTAVVRIGQRYPFKYTVSPMKLDAALSLAEDRIRPMIREERARLVSDIEAMRRQYAAKGLLRSGATLKRIRDLGIESQTRRINAVFSIVKDSVATVVSPPSDAETLMPMIVRFFPEDLDDQGEHVRKAVADLGVPNALSQLLDALAVARSNEFQKSEADLKLFLAKLNQSSAPSNNERVFGVLDLILLVITISLIALWIMNPSGPYEPYLALIAAAVTGIDLMRKWRRT